VAAVAFLLAFYVSPAGRQLRNRTQWYQEDPLGGARLRLWTDTLRLSAAHFPLGAGLETFSSAFPPFQSKELSRKYPDFYYESPHNIFLDSLAEQGVAGLAVLLLLIAWGFRSATRARSRYPKLADLLAAWLLGGLLAHQFACFTVPTALFFFVNLALIASLVGSEQTGEKERRVILAVAALPVSLVFCVFGVRLMMADRQLALTEHNLRRLQVADAIRSYQRFRWWRPPGLNADLWFSRSLAKVALQTPDLRLRLEAGQKALEAARLAAASAEDRHNALYNLAVLSAAAGDRRATEYSLRLAIRAAPSWYKPHWALARLLQVTGRNREAIEEARTAADLNAGRQQAVSDTFNSISTQTGAAPDRTAR
jgi:tetratricopeptide (TPR) repeat protein